MEQIIRKTYTAFCLIFSVFVLSSCDTDENKEDIVPPVQEILREDTTGTMGDLLVDVYYLKEGWDTKLIPAPYGTSVYLYETEYDLDNDFPMYRFMVTDSNAVYMGYLEMKSYYVLAFDEINGTNYENIEKVTIRQRNEKATVTMYKINSE